MPETLTPERLTFEVDADHLAASGAAGTREVTGLAVPYEEATYRPSWQHGTNYIRIAEGAAKVRDTAVLYAEHDHENRKMPVGKITGHEQTPEGLRITARLSETAKGEEVYTLLKEGVFSRFSIGFYPVTSVIENADTEQATLVLTEIDVYETSTVVNPQYDSAQVETVFSRTTPAPTTKTKETATMPETLTAEHVFTKEDGEALSAEVDKITRQLATIGDHLGSDAPSVEFGSYGEFIKAFAAGKPEAITFVEAVFNGLELAATTGDIGGWLKDSWVGDIIRNVDKGRPFINFFESSPLPAEGMNVEFGKLNTDTTQVAEQAAQGDTLAYGKISLTIDNAPVKTYGGWTDYTRQVVDRSSVTYVQRVFQALVRRYTQATEAGVRAVVLAATGAHATTATVPGTADEWIDFVVEGAMHLDGKGLVGELLAVDSTTFTDLAKLRDGANGDAPRLLNRDSGQMDIKGLTGDLFNITVRPVSGWAAGTIRLCAPEAIQTYESAGAPFQLVDGDITKLTEALSIYGYMAVADQEPDAIVVPAAGV